MTGIVALAVVLGGTFAVALVLRARSGKVRRTGAAPAGGARADLIRAAGVAGPGPTVLHFAADWCGPCAAVRRVVGRTTAALDARLDPAAPRPTEVEVDIDENPTLASELGVLSLPTTFIFDADGRQRYRVSGVPTVSDLEAALVPLCESEGSHRGETR